MKRNQIGKHMEVLMRNGFRAETIDGYKNRPVRLMKVFGAEQGFYDEMGSAYASDIVAVKVNGDWVDVE